MEGRANISLFCVLYSAIKAHNHFKAIAASSAWGSIVE